ncbi:putative ATP-dependent RNA helicase Dbp73D [Haemaphysalis longicornis]
MEKLYVVSRFTDDADVSQNKAIDPDKRLRKILRKAKRKQEEARHTVRDENHTGEPEAALEDSRFEKNGKKRQVTDDRYHSNHMDDAEPDLKKVKSELKGCRGDAGAEPAGAVSAQTPKKNKNRRKKSLQPRVRRNRSEARNESLTAAEKQQPSVDPTVGNEYAEDPKPEPPSLDNVSEASDLAKNGEPDPPQEELQASSGQYYPVLGDVQVKKTEAVHRVLPDWLSNPETVACIVKKGKKPGSKKVANFSSSLSAEMMSVLAANHIKRLFPVQEKVIPWLLSSEQRRSLMPPRDICVSAPTGSGKTLAYVIPIVEALKCRVVRAIRAVVVLPVKELATQVYNVFLQFVRETSLKVQLVTGTRPFAEEQAALVRQSGSGYVSLVDIVVATPGRLLDHIRKTPGFTLSLLKFFVLDEADRVIEDVQTTLIPEVEQAVFGTGKHNCCCGATAHSRLSTHPLTACCLQQCREPVQKLLYSATLTQDPDKLQSLMLFQPKLFTAAAAAPREEQQQKAFVGKYTTPQGLSEFYYLTHDNTKPLAVWDLVANHGFQDTLCFTASKEDAHRLSLVLKEMGGVRAEEFSAKLSTAERARVLRRFTSGKLDVLVCSNVLARGLDVTNVRHVICYDPPKFIKTYVHRVGRTARAGVPGTAVTFMRQGQLPAFKAMLASAGKQDIQALDLGNSDGLEAFQSKYRDALKTVAAVVKSELEGPERGKKYSFAQRSSLPNVVPTAEALNGSPTA